MEISFLLLILKIYLVLKTIYIQKYEQETGTQIEAIDSFLKIVISRIALALPEEEQTALLQVDVSRIPGLRESITRLPVEYALLRQKSKRSCTTSNYC